MAKKTPALELLTTVPDADRDFITIDGVRYLLRRYDELRLSELDHIARMGEQISQAGEEGDYARIEALYAASVKSVVMDIPDEVLGKLTPAQLGAILSVFTRLAADGNSREVSSPLPPDSSDSTAGASPTG